MPVFQPECFVRLRLIIRIRIQKFAVQASSGNQIHRDSQCVFQISGKSAHLQATNGALVDAQVYITVLVGIVPGIGAEQINTGSSVPGSQNCDNFLDFVNGILRICPSLPCILLLFYHNYVETAANISNTEKTVCKWGRLVQILREEVTVNALDFIGDLR